jgi:hypothetical protein
MAALHADGNMGTDAEFRRPPGAWLALRITLSKPASDLLGLGGIGARAGTIEAVMLAADYAPLSPMRGDEVRIAGTVHRVEAVEPDALRLSWRLILAPTG